MHNPARSDQRRGAIHGTHHRRHTGSRRLENEAGQLRGGSERDELVVCRRSAGIERRLENSLHTGIGARHAEHDRLCRPGWCHEPRVVARGNLPKPHRSNAQHAAHFLLEDRRQIAIGRISDERVT